jgi:hypothetical protein
VIFNSGESLEGLFNIMAFDWDVISPGFKSHVRYAWCRMVVES